MSNQDSLRYDREDALQALQDILGIVPAESPVGQIASRAIAKLVGRALELPEGSVASDRPQCRVKIDSLGVHIVKQWLRRVFRVNPEIGTGYAFDGPWLKLGVWLSLPAPAVLLHYVQADHSPKSSIVKLLLLGVGDEQATTVAVGSGRHWARELLVPTQQLLDTLWGK